jgi:hypothetical protein
MTSPTSAQDARITELESKQRQLETQLRHEQMEDW